MSSTHHRTSCRGEFNPARRQTSSRGDPGSRESGTDDRTWTDGPEPANAPGQNNNNKLCLLLFYKVLCVGNFSVKSVSSFIVRVQSVTFSLRKTDKYDPWTCCWSRDVVRTNTKRCTTSRDGPGLWTWSLDLQASPVVLCWWWSCSAASSTSTRSRVPPLKATEKETDCPLGRDPTHQHLQQETDGDYRTWEPETQGRIRC